MTESDIMIASPPRLSDVANVMPRADGGYWVVPHVLPIDVPREALRMTVAEWIGAEGRSPGSPGFVGSA